MIWRHSRAADAARGKIALLRRTSATVAAGQDASFPKFSLWHRPDLFEFVVCRLEEWVGGPRGALGPRCQAFAKLVRGLAGWEGDSATPPSVPGPS